MGPFVDADGNRCSIEQVVRNLLKEDVTYESSHTLPNAR